MHVMLAADFALDAFSKSASKLPAFGIFIAPWVTFFGKSKVHFTQGRVNFCGWFNCVAATLATGLYAFYVILGPTEWTLTLNIWRQLSIAMACAIAYTLLFLYGRSKVEKLAWRWIIAAALVSYCGIFVAVALAFVSPALNWEYYIFSGTVQSNAAEILEIKLLNHKEGNREEEEKPVGSASTRSDGSFILWTPRTDKGGRERPVNLLYVSNLYGAARKLVTGQSEREVTLNIQ